ncbi:MAG: hypothetical protein ACFE7R_07370, partial [Candidatus Hodarchaeota archaeon]
MNSGSEPCKLEVGEETISLSNDLVTITYTTLTGTLSMSTREGDILFTKAYIQVHSDRGVYDSRRMVYKSISSLDFQDKRGEGKAIVIRLQDTEKTAEVNVRFSMVRSVPGYTCIVQVKNREGSVRIKSLDPFVQNVSDSSKIHTGRNGQELRFFKNGFHSWELTQALPLSRGVNLSHLFSVLTNKNTGQSLVLGFVTSMEQLTEITFLGGENNEKILEQLRASSLADNILLPEKQTAVSEELLLLAGCDGLGRQQRRRGEVQPARSEAIPQVDHGAV